MPDYPVGIDHVTVVPEDHAHGDRDDDADDR